MTDVLLTFHCATADRDTLSMALRSAARAPIHVRREAVLGRDFSDARASEQVTGELERDTLELIVEEGTVAEVVQAVTDAPCRLPVRWRVIPVLSRGRIG